MSLYLCKEERTDNGGYLVPIRELIRCKDCKWWIDGFCMNHESMAWTADDFCSMAEREEEE